MERLAFQHLPYPYASEDVPDPHTEYHTREPGRLPPLPPDWLLKNGPLYAWEPGLPFPEGDPGWTTCRPPLVAPAGETAAGKMARLLNLKRVVANCAMCCQMHVKHNTTCSLGGRTGDDWDCRLGMPRCPTTVLPATVFDEKRGTFMMGRGSKSMVPYCPALMLAWVRIAPFPRPPTPHVRSRAVRGHVRGLVGPGSFPCPSSCPHGSGGLSSDADSSCLTLLQPTNHSFYFNNETSRHRRDLDIYERACEVAKAAAKRGDHSLNNRLPPHPPRPLDVEEHSMECAVYGTKYNIKLDAVDTATSLIAAVASLYPFVNRFSGTEALPSCAACARNSANGVVAASSSAAAPHASAADEAAAKGRRMIARLTNKVLGASFFSATYVALVLGSFGDHRKSHDTRVFVPKQFAEWCATVEAVLHRLHGHVREERQHI